MPLPAKETLRKIIRLALGTENDATLNGEVAWDALLELSTKEGVGGLVIKGLEKVFEKDASLGKLNTLELKPIRNKWLTLAMKIEMQDKLQNSRIAELSSLLQKDGFVSCVLKGQGVAQLYPEPLSRQCGDIDLWMQPAESKGISEDRWTILDYLRSKWKTGKAVYHHVEVKAFKGTSLEVHYLPSWLYYPPANRKLQAFYREQAHLQFENFREDVGFSIPTPLFNLVFSITHLYKHTFEENVVLKQLVDYHYILLSSSREDRLRAYDILCSIGLGKFTAYIMYRLKNELGTPSDVFLCPPSKVCRRPLGEAICFFPWRVWHYLWRKKLNQ